MIDMEALSFAPIRAVPYSLVHGYPSVRRVAVLPSSSSYCLMPILPLLSLHSSPNGLRYGF